MRRSDFSGHIITIGLDFAERPLGRYESDSPNNGSKFRDMHLLPALRKYPHVTVLLDGTHGYGNSFLDEAFAGLISKGHFSLQQLQEKLTIDCIDSAYRIYISEIWEYIEEAQGVADGKL